MAESVNQCRYGKYVSRFLLHCSLERGYGFFETLLLQQRQAETKVKLVPRGLKFDRLRRLRVRCLPIPMVEQPKQSERRVAFGKLVIQRHRLQGRRLRLGKR